MNSDRRCANSDWAPWKLPLCCARSCPKLTWPSSLSMERSAWQRLVRVLGHELNNSLAPIKSVAGSLADLLARQPRPADWGDDMQRGLEVISSRAHSLARFVESYSELARLPPPRFESLSIGELVRRVASLETRLPVSVVSGSETTVRGDSAQLEQLLINLLRNAVDA